MANSAGVLFGADVSHHQAALDVGSLRTGGVEFVIARTAQAPGGKYGKTIDRMYATHKANALRAGQLFSSYFYLGSGLSAEGNANLHASIEPDRKVPVMLDWEEGSGNGAFLAACVGAFQNAGYYVWGTYAPRWYWQAQGSPSLAGLPPLVSSRYPDMAPGSLPSEYAGTPEAYWSGYGGNSVQVLQFTSGGRVPPYGGNLDLNAFKGTRAQLAALWAVGSPNPIAPVPNTGEDVSLIERRTLPASPDTRTEYFRNLPGGQNCKIVVRVPDFNWTTRVGTVVWQGDIIAFGSNDAGIGHNPKAQPGFDASIDKDTEFYLPGALTASYSYSCISPVVIEIYG